MESLTELEAGILSRLGWLSSYVLRTACFWPQLWSYGQVQQGPTFSHDVMVSVLLLGRNTLTIAMEIIQLGFAYSCIGLVHCCSGWDRSGTQADIILEKELRVPGQCSPTTVFP